MQRPTPSPATHRHVLLAALVVVLAGFAAYLNSFHGPFVHDDVASIVNNPTIQHGFAAALSPPTEGETVTGRPLVNLTFALNYSVGGQAVFGYHAVNLAIHLIAALALFGLVRRTLLLPRLAPKFGAAALPVAFAAALGWTLHPLQTESVTYIAQRSESLAGLFYLLTFYALARALAEEKKSAVWLSVSALACLLGIFCKETVATAPLLAVLYDRAFAAGTFAETFRRRAKYYAALAATWLPLGWLVWSAHGRGNTAGLATGISAQDYLLTQARAITTYLQLSLWPRPLVFDYGTTLVTHPAEVAPQLIFIAALLAATLWLCWKKPLAGFLGAWFFATLAPSSSFIPVATETMAEHRMYLALAALTVGAALALHRVAGVRGLLALAAVGSLLLGTGTILRNRLYQSPLALWGDTAAKMPANARAFENYATALLADQQLQASAAASRRALDLQPDYPEAENNLGIVFAALGQPADAAPHFVKAAAGLRLPREQALAWFNLGNALGSLGKLNEALVAFTEAAQLQPDYAPAHNLRGYALAKLGHYPEAIAEYQQALQLQPDYPQCAANLAAARAALARGAP